MAVASNQCPRRGAFFLLALGGFPEIVLHPPLHRSEKEKPSYCFDSIVSFVMAERLGFEPTVILLPRLISIQIEVNSDSNRTA